MLERSPMAKEEIVDQFDRLVGLVTPQKTLQELREEEQQEIWDNEHGFHHVPVAITLRKATCGWTGGARGRLYGTSDWDALSSHQELYNKVKEAAGPEAARRALNTGGRVPCSKCLSLRPVEFVEQS